MTKLIAAAVALLFCIGFTTTGFAEITKAKAERIKGEIASIDTTANTIIIKDEKTGADRSVNVDATVIASLKAGERVKVKLKPGTNTALKITPMPAKKKQ